MRVGKGSKERISEDNAGRVAIKKENVGRGQVKEGRGGDKEGKSR